MNVGIYLRHLIILKERQKAAICARALLRIKERIN